MQIVRSDNGGEYKNRKIARFFHDRGIKTEYREPYIPHQNGVAERRDLHHEFLASRRFTGKRRSNMRCISATVCTPARSTTTNILRPSLWLQA